MEENTPDISQCQQSLYNKVLNSCNSSDAFISMSTPKNSCSSVKKRVLYNPFNGNLKERLQNHTCSPSVFSIVVSPSQNSDVFKWTIDDLSKINPVPIEEEFIYEDQLDEKTEIEIQKTIETYFKAKHLIPSPWNCKVFSDYSKDNCVIESGTDTHDGAVNISLGLPVNLTKDIENSLKTKLNMNCGEDRGNVDSLNFPRKLFFNSEDELLSPVKFPDAEQSLSPEITGCGITRTNNVCYPSTPVLECRTICTPPPSNLSPIDISPIKRTRTKSIYSCQSDTSLMPMDISSTSVPGSQHMSVDESSFINQNTMAEFVGQDYSNIVDSPKSVFKRRKIDGRSVVKVTSEVSDNGIDMDLNSYAHDTGYCTEDQQHTRSLRVFKNSNGCFSASTSSKLKSSFVNSFKWDEQNKENYVAKPNSTSFYPSC